MNCCEPDSQRLGDETDESLIRLSLLGGGAHAGSKGRSAIGKHCKTGDFVACAFRGEADKEQKIALPRAPGGSSGHGTSENVGVYIFQNDTFDKKDEEQQDHRRNIDSSEIGDKAADGLKKRLR